MRLGLIRRSSVRLLAIVAILMGIISACQSEPQTEYLLEVTRIVVVTATPSLDGTPVATIDSQTVDPDTEIPPTSEPQATNIVGVAPTSNPIPAPVSEQVIVAEQIFENGRMFYLQPTNEIWVMADDNNEWLIFSNTWEEGMPEFDPNMIIQEGFYQPERGFGKLWRENENVRNALGWAIESEVGHVTTYTYSFGGTINNEGEFVQTSISHTINSYYGGVFLFESPNGTWRRAPDTDQ